MKNTSMLIFSLITLLTTSGCQLIRNTLLGFRDAKEKTEEQLLRYEKRKGLQTDNNYYICDSAVFADNLNKILSDSITYLEVYNRDGFLLPQYDTADCPAPLSRYLQTICAETPESHKDLHLNDKMKTLTPFKNNTAAASFNYNDYDYTIVINWARFMGIFNKKNARTFERLLKEQKDCKIHYFKVTMDPVNISR